MSAHILTATHLDVWLARTDGPRDPARVAEYEALLSPVEHERLDRLRGEHARDLYLVTRALIRTTLSRYDRVAPGCWQLTVNAHGRPELVPGQTRLDLRFNASHTANVVACAITLGRQVGIDIEHHDLRSPVVTLAERFLAPTEARDVAAQPPDRRLDRFFRYWTLRESYFKALGVGLGGASSDVSFELGDGDAIRLRAPDAEHWRCWQWQPDSAHTVAVTAAFAPDEAVHVRIHDVIPLG